MRETPYRTVKRSIAEGIARGQWQTGALLPSEPALCATFRVSRMTVNRAMRELAAERRVRRVPGVGTFVADALAQSGLVEIRNIAEEITARGHDHQAKVLRLRAETATAAIAAELDVVPGSPVFRSMLVHSENGIPLQLEDRYVRPSAAPGYLEQDFSCLTPNAFLTRVAPLSEAEHLVQAIPAPRMAAARLGMPPGAPCLLVVRRTFSGGVPVSLAHLLHPGDRFRLGARFAPSGKAAS